MRPVLALMVALAATACAVDDEMVDGRDDSFFEDGKADAYGVTEGSPEACAVLRLVNEATLDELRTVTNPAASHIEAYRTGNGTANGPQTIDSLVELDAVHYVGPNAFGKLLAYAVVHYPCGAPPAPAGPSECMILRAANESTVDQLDVEAGLDRRAATAIVAAQPLASIEALDAVPYVGQGAIDLLGEYAAAKGLSCEATCAGTGGTFDGVTYSRDEECHAIDFMNLARLSQMAGLGATLRHYVYDCTPSAGRLDCTQGRVRAWTRLSEIDSEVGGAGFTELKAAAAGWTDDGQHSDTIAAVWTNRSTLIGAPVGFDKVFVARRTNPSSMTRFCYELRDAPGAANFLTACVWLTRSDGAPPCSFASCLDPLVGQSVALRGTLKAESFAGGVGITVYPGQRPLPPRE